MRWKSSKTIVVFAMLAMVLALVPGAWAGEKKEILYSFKGGNDGGYPTYSPLIFDKAGNLYGTTFDGGIGPLGGFGTVFELTPKADGSWTETVLHRFTGGRDGAFPHSGVVLDDLGDLYGTTEFGGGLGSCPLGGANYYCGTVYRISPQAHGGWNETVLMRFDNARHGGYPVQSLILDRTGNLYGVAGFGKGCGGGGCGMVFELLRQRTVPWKETIIYEFNGSDGADSWGPLLFDPSGNMYGTTIGGGAANAGVVFKLAPTKRGQWAETILHTFTPQNHDGARPNGQLTFDKQGNLYGATQAGGKNTCHGLGCGVVYELARDSWKETILHDFYGNHFNGIDDDTQGVAFDLSGNLYGTATGTAHFPGGIFRLVHQRETWVEHLIYKFPPGVSPGMATYGPDGRLYGASYSGGKYNLGQVYRIVP